MLTQVHMAQLTREKVERSRAEDIRALEKEMDDRLKIMTETMEAAEDKHGILTHSFPIQNLALTNRFIFS